MWQLSFLEADGMPYANGTWYIRLSLLTRSPATFLDSHLLIEDVRTESVASPSSTRPLAPSVSSSSKSLFGTPEPRDPKPIELRLKTSGEQLVPYADAVGCATEICVPLSKSPMGSSLQFEYVCVHPAWAFVLPAFFVADAFMLYYSGCTYIASDGSLTAKLEARLAKPDGECIIC
jgi:hypothetical protein